MTSTSILGAIVDVVSVAARAAHEVNRAYCASLGDLSQPSWDEAPDWQKTSAKLGVLAILDNPNHTPADSHVSWLLHKESEGWVWGPEKNPELKQHPCMVPYAELPAEQQVKDQLFIAAVRAVLSELSPKVA